MVGLEGEIFADYALSLARTGAVIASMEPFGSDDEEGADDDFYEDYRDPPIVVGYANGCVGYVPTEAEFPLGGYEVCNAFRVYGQPAMLAGSFVRA